MNSPNRFLSNKIITDVQYSDSHFFDRTFSRCKFKNVDFSGAELSFVKFTNCQFDLVSFYKAEIYCLTFQNCILNKIEFTKAEIDECKFRNSELKNVDFSGSDFCGIKFDQVKFIDVLFFGCVVEEEFQITNSSANQLSVKNMRMKIQKLNSNPDESMQYETVIIETHQDFLNYNPGLLSVDEMNMKNRNRRRRNSYVFLFYTILASVTPIFLISW